jgi:hypothetical protein
MKRLGIPEQEVAQYWGDNANLWADHVRQTSALFPDTRPEAEAVLIGLLRQAPPWRKLAMVGQLNQTVRTLALSGLRTRHPEATPQELRRRLADLLLGPDLAAQVYGPQEVQEAANAA